jgi:hypothetical protein
MLNEYGTVGGMRMGRGAEVMRETSLIPHDLTWD